MSKWYGQQSKVGAAQQEKNHWKGRCGRAEGLVKYIRNVVDNPENDNDTVVDILVRLIDEWEELNEKHGGGDEPKCPRCRGTGLVNYSDLYAVEKDTVDQ